MSALTRPSFGLSLERPKPMMDRSAPNHDRRTWSRCSRLVRASLRRTGVGLVLLFVSLASGFAAADGSNADETEHPKTFLDRGDRHVAAREFDQAIAEYTRAIALKPNFAEAYNNRAYANYSKYDGTGDPLSDLNRAIELRPDYPHALNTRGCVYLSGGDLDRALADFSRAIELQPDYPRAYRNRANAYARTGQTALAIADWERAGGNPKQLILYGFAILAFVILLIVVTGAFLMRSLPRRTKPERSVIN